VRAAKYALDLAPPVFAEIQREKVPDRIGE